MKNKFIQPLHGKDSKTKRDKFFLRSVLKWLPRALLKPKEILKSASGYGVADGIRTRNNKLHKLGLYH
jgi:hypothetical protein